MMGPVVNRKPSESTHDLAMRALQRLVFGPLLFQAAVLLRRRGVLRELGRTAFAGLTLDEVQSRTGLSAYGTRVLLDAGEAAELVEARDGRFFPTRLGLLLEKDPLTLANLNFVADVCYRPAAHLEQALDTAAPSGLAELGDFPNVYQGLAELSPEAHESWLAFDHFYSDAAFPTIVEQLRARNAKSLLDVGGNTGRFALVLSRTLPELAVTIADLPGQIELARRHLKEADCLDRIQLVPTDVLAKDAELPSGHELIWMSQFLCCFSEAEIKHILGQARRALAQGGELWILETLIDRQNSGAARVALQATSLYFTCVANGKGRMYHSQDLERLVLEAGFEIQRRVEPIGWGHTLIQCRARD